MSARGLLHNGDYLKLLIGQTVSGFGSAMSSFVFVLIAMSITGSPAKAGLVGTAYALGGTLMALPGGALADRISRRTIMVGYSLGGAILYGSVAVAGWAGHLTVLHLILVSFCGGLGYSCFAPAQSGALRQIVDPDDLSTALSANQGRQFLAALGGAPLGGLLFSIGRVVPVAVDAVSYFVMAVLLATIRKPLRAAEPDGDAHEPMLRAIRSGLAWLVRQPALLTIALVATGINFAALGTILVLVLDLQQAGTPASIIGLLETGMGVGGIVGSIVAPKLLARFGTGRLAITSSWITAITFTATGFARQPAVLIVLLFTALLLLPAFNSGLFGYQMLITPDSFQGRAQSAIGFLATSTNPLAPLLAGVLLTAAGARPTLLFFGALLALCAFALTVSRSIRAIPLLSDVHPVAAA